MLELEILEGEDYDTACERLAKQGASREDLIAFAQKNHDNVIDFDALPAKKHNWHDQGLKISCWDAGHPMHQVWKPRGVKRIS